MFTVAYCEIQQALLLSQAPAHHTQTHSMRSLAGLLEPTRHLTYSQGCLVHDAHQHLMLHHLVSMNHVHLVVVSAKQRRIGC